MPPCDCDGVTGGPVANAPSAIAERPNVFVDGGQSMDIGTLNLGGSAIRYCRARTESAFAEVTAEMGTTGARA